MKKIVLLVFVFISANSFAQELNYYASAKAGLSMREQPNANAKVLEKIPYGSMLVTLSDTTKAIQITTEGFNGFWWKVKYNNKVGYIVSSYVLPFAPPKVGVKDMKQYFAQLSSAAGSPVVIKKGVAEMEGDASTLKKQLYKNGMEWHEMQGYENAAHLFIIPDITVENAFLILRLLQLYPDLISEKDPLPTKNGTIKKQYGDHTIKIDKDIWYENVGVLRELTIDCNEGAMTELKILRLDSQIIISWSSGV
jgi:hypothetical protein